MPAEGRSETIWMPGAPAGTGEGGSKVGAAFSGVRSHPWPSGRRGGSVAARATAGAGQRRSGAGHWPAEGGWQAFCPAASTHVSATAAGRDCVLLGCVLRRVSRRLLRDGKPFTGQVGLDRLSVEKAGA